MLLDLLSDSFRKPAECRIMVAGEQIADLYPFLTEVKVDMGRTGAAEAILNFESRRDENGEWLVQDAGILKDWQSIVIEAVFGDDSEEVFNGYIRQVKVAYPETGNATVNVTCQDQSLALDREHHRKVWGKDAPTSDTVIVADILKHHGLSMHANSGPGQSGIVVNQDETDITFLRKRADANAYELMFTSKGVYFGPWRVVDAPQSTIMVNAGKDTNCLSFSPDTDGHQPDAVSLQMAAATGSKVVTEKVQSNLQLMGAETAASSSSGLDDFVWQMSREGGADQQVLKGKAQKKANELAMKIKASGELDGSLYGHVLRVAEPVGVDGIGKWLGGVYYVDSVTHTFNYNGYRQNFKLLRNAYGDNLPSGVGNALSAIL